MKKRDRIAKKRRKAEELMAYRYKRRRVAERVFEALRKKYRPLAQMISNENAIMLAIGRSEAFFGNLHNVVYEPIQYRSAMMDYVRSMPEDTKAAFIKVYK